MKLVNFLSILAHFLCFVRLQISRARTIDELIFLSTLLHQIFAEKVYCLNTYGNISQKFSQINRCLSISMTAYLNLSNDEFI